MLYRKITEGCVVQVFNDAGECIGQQFHAGDEVEYETGEGLPINSEDMPLAGREYHAFDMAQPGDNIPLDDVTEALQLNI